MFSRKFAFKAILSLSLSSLLTQNQVLALQMGENLFCYLVGHRRLADRSVLFTNLYQGPQQIHPNDLRKTIILGFSSHRGRLDPRWQSLITAYRNFYKNRKTAEAKRRVPSPPTRTRMAQHCYQHPHAAECVVAYLRGDLPVSRPPEKPRVFGYTHHENRSPYYVQYLHMPIVVHDVDLDLEQTDVHIEAETVPSRSVGPNHVTIPPLTFRGVTATDGPDSVRVESYRSEGSGTLRSGDQTTARSYRGIEIWRCPYAEEVPVPPVPFDTEEGDDSNTDPTSNSGNFGELDTDPPEMTYWQRPEGIPL